MIYFNCTGKSLDLVSIVHGHCSTCYIQYSNNFLESIEDLLYPRHDNSLKPSTYTSFGIQIFRKTQPIPGLVSWFSDTRSDTHIDLIDIIYILCQMTHMTPKI